MLTLEQKRAVMKLDPSQFTAPPPRDRSELWIGLGLMALSIAGLIFLLWRS